MPRNIYAVDYTSPKSLLIIILASLLLIMAAVLGLFLHSDLWIPPALLGVFLYIILCRYSFFAACSLSIAGGGATLKLVGHKTFGFRVDQIYSLTLNDESLIILFHDTTSVVLPIAQYSRSSLKEVKYLLTQRQLGL